MTGRDPDEGDETDPRDPPSDDPDELTDGPDEPTDGSKEPSDDSGVPNVDFPGDWTTADDHTPHPDEENASDPPADSSTADSHADSPTVDSPGGERSTDDRTISGGGSRTSRSSKPPAPGVDDAEPTIREDGVWTWFRTSNHGAVVVVRDIASSVATVAAIGLVLFAVSGIWPPLVAVESGSMEPHMSKGDLVFIVDETRYAPQSSVADTGVSTLQSARDANGYAKFGNLGDVIVYKPSGGDGTPIIHRARFHVEEGENWIDRADPAYLGAVDECHEVPRNMCPAPYDGFVTKGDANPTYDQIGDQSTIVKSEWIRGKAAVRIPLLGWIRLHFAELALALVNGGGQALGGALGFVTRTGSLAIGLGVIGIQCRR